MDIFTQSGFNEIPFGEADVLARAKNISVGGLEDSGAVISSRGRVRLRDRDEMPVLIEKNLNQVWLKILVEANCAWLWVQSLVYALKKIGIAKAGELMSKFVGNNESLKNLAYRLYDICEKKNWSKEATGYNDLVVEWQTILETSVTFKQPKPVQGTMF